MNLRRRHRAPRLVVAVLCLISSLVFVAGADTASAEVTGPSYQYVDDADQSVKFLQNGAAVTSRWQTYPGDSYFGGTTSISPSGVTRPGLIVTWFGGQAQMLVSTWHNGQVQGRAKVTLDNVVHYVDYSTPDHELHFQKILFDTGPLANGKHTLRLEALDQRGEHANQVGAGIRISFDALVYGDCLPPGTAACDISYPGDEMSDADLFAALDLNKPGLSAVKAAVESNDLATAKQKLADYFRAQPSRSLSLYGVQQPSPAADYVTTMADDIICNNVGCVRKLYPPGTNPVTGARSSHYYEVANAYWWTGNDKYAATLGTWFTQYVSQVRAHRHIGLTLSLRVHPHIHAFFAIQNAPYTVVSVDARMAALKMFLATGRDLHRRNADPANDPTNTAANMWAISGNAGTTVAMTFPEFADSQKWMESGLEQVEIALTESVYPDGAVTELATGYSGQYALMATGLTELAQRMNLTPHPVLSSEQAKMSAAFWVWMHHPDGSMPMLGDGDANGTSEQTFGGGTSYVDGGSIVWTSNPNPYREFIDKAPPGWYTVGLSRTELVRRGADLFDEPSWKAAVDQGPASDWPTPSHAYEWAGWYVQRSGFTANARFLVFDAGPFSSSSHGHQDKLSIDMFAYGRPLIVDTGRYSYNTGQHNRLHRWFASTAGHSTIYVNDCLQNQKIETLTQPVSDAAWASDRFFDVAGGTYDEGYTRSPSFASPAPTCNVNAQHDRSVFFVKPNYWIITDRVDNLPNGKVTSNYHFAPGNAVINPNTKATTFVTEPAADGSQAGVVLVSGGNPWDTAAVNTGVGATETSSMLNMQGWYAPVYGRLDAAPQVTYTRQGSLPMVSTTVVYPFAGGTAPDIQSRTLAVQATAGNPSATTITRPGGTDLYTNTDVAGVEQKFGPAGSRATLGSTDAGRAFLARQTNGALESFALYDGKYLDLGGRTIISTSSTVSQLSGQVSGKGLDIEAPLGLQTTARIAVPASITTVTVNGTAVPFSWSAGYAIVQIGSK